MATKNTDIANILRVLAMDAVEEAKCGHPGMPMGMADIAEVLWRKHLIHNPKNPNWPNRDRFVLSNGHGSMLMYALLHLSGYDLSLDEIKNFSRKDWIELTNEVFDFAFKDSPIDRTKYQGLKRNIKYASKQF